MAQTAVINNYFLKKFFSKTCHIAAILTPLGLERLGTTHWWSQGFKSWETGPPVPLVVAPMPPASVSMLATGWIDHSTDQRIDNSWTQPGFTT